MKKTALLCLLLLCTSLAFSQKKEKIKGTKIVTLESKEIEEFENLEVSDNLEIFLVKGDKCALEIEADDNLHDAIDINAGGGTLRLTANKEVTSAKKFSVKVTYTDDFKMIIAKDDANITALTDLVLDNITFKLFNSARIFSTVKSKKFTLMANDKAKIELNLKAEETVIELSKNANLKALISSSKMTFDMYQKTLANIEGDVIDLKLRLDNNADFIGKNLTSKNAEITTDGYVNCSILVDTKAIIAASGKSEIQLHGEQKVIEIIKFTENAVISKRNNKVK